jgi:hypothetical protein
MALIAVGAALLGPGATASAAPGDGTTVTPPPGGPGNTDVTMSLTIANRSPDTSFDVKALDIQERSTRAVKVRTQPLDQAPVQLPPSGQRVVSATMTKIADSAFPVRVTRPVRVALVIQVAQAVPAAAPVDRAAAPEARTAAPAGSTGSSASGSQLSSARAYQSFLSTTPGSAKK